MIEYIAAGPSKASIPSAETRSLFAFTLSVPRARTRRARSLSTHPREPFRANGSPFGAPLFSTVRRRRPLDLFSESPLMRSAARPARGIAEDRR